MTATKPVQFPYFFAALAHIMFLKIEYSFQKNQLRWQMFTRTLHIFYNLKVSIIKSLLFQISLFFRIYFASEYTKIINHFNIL